MADHPTPDQLLSHLRRWLRNDYRRAFESGLSWGWPRCRTEEERLLFPLLLAALSPYSAVVAHRRMPEGGTLSFVVSISRDTPEGVERIQWRITDEPNGESERDEHAVVLSSEQVWDTPWAAVSGLLAAIQGRLLTPPEPEG